MSRTKRLQVLPIQRIQLRPSRQERRSGVRHFSPSVVQRPCHSLRPEVSAIPTRPSRRRGRRRLREQPGTPRASRSFSSVREGLHGFVPRACLLCPEAASQASQLRAVRLACRDSLSTGRRLISPFRFSRFQNLKISDWKHADGFSVQADQCHRHHVARRSRVEAPKDCRNIIQDANRLQAFCSRDHCRTLQALGRSRSPRAFANFVHIGSQQSSPRRSGTRSATAGIVFAVSFDPLRFECGNTGFECRDSVGGILAENVGPVLHDAQSARGYCIAYQGDHGRQDPSNLFSIKPGRCWNAGSVASFAECNVAGGTGDSGERFSKARRLRKGDQLREFRRPSEAPKKKTAAVGSFRLAASG